MQSKKNAYKEQIAKLETIKNNLISDPLSKKVLDQWFEYEKMTIKEKDALMEDWDKYFELVRSTKSFLRYGKISQLFKQHKPIGGFVEKAREQIKDQTWEFPKPYLEDPIYLRANQYVVSYQSIVSKINTLRLQSQMDDIAETLL